MKIVSVAEMRALERAAINSGTPEYELMLRAGRAAAAIINQHARGFDRVVILAGGGNNAGDALVAANALNLPCVIYLTRPVSCFKGAAAQAAAELKPEIPRQVVENFVPELLQPGDLVVDALLGIGFHGTEVSEPVAGFIRIVNQSGLPVIALDLPSGLNGDTGAIAADDCAIRAQWTITFGAPKTGLLRGQGPELSGRLQVVPIGLDLAAPDSTEIELFTPDDAAKFTWQLPWNSHKNSRGRLTILAGSRDYPGAAVLTTLAALRAGCGVVRLATTAHRGLSRLPAAALCRELSGTPDGTLNWTDFAAVQDYCGAAQAVVAGPGWGRVPQGVLQELLQLPSCLLLDADALNLVARYPELWKPHADVVITPHPGEAARLARAFELPENLSRVELAGALARRLGAITLLKGFHTVVAAPDGRISLNATGGPELATAGSGDVLAGIIGALLAQNFEPYAAARLGALWHGLAGELLGAGLIADDLPGVLPAIRQKFALKQPFR